jgi:hypothetical protein
MKCYKVVGFKGIEFEGMIATVESLVQQLLTIKKLN